MFLEEDACTRDCCVPAGWSELCAGLQPQPNQNPEIKLSPASVPKRGWFQKLCNKAPNARKAENYCVLKHRWCVFSIAISLQDESWEMLQLYLPSSKKCSPLQAIARGSLLSGLLKLCRQLEENSKLPEWSSKWNCRKGSQVEGPSPDRWYSKFFVSAIRVLGLCLVIMWCKIHKSFSCSQHRHGLCFQNGFPNHQLESCSSGFMNLLHIYTGSRRTMDGEKSTSATSLVACWVHRLQCPYPPSGFTWNLTREF